MIIALLGVHNGRHVAQRAVWSTGIEPSEIAGIRYLVAVSDVRQFRACFVKNRLETNFEYSKRYILFKVINSVRRTGISRLYSGLMTSRRLLILGSGR